MIHFGGYEDYAASVYHFLLVANSHARPAAYHVVQFIFLMGLLRVSATGRQQVNAGAHSRHAKKFLVALAGLGACGGDGGQVKEVPGHGPGTARAPY
jgi:hypothetical protein